MVELGDPGPGRPPEKRLGRKRRAVGRGALWLLRAVVAVGVVSVLLFFFLTRTDPGAGITIGQILQRLPLNGTIRVEDVRSDRLLEGVRLYGVSITGNDGRTFLLADSAVLSYDWRTLVGGDVIFDRLDLFQPEVVISRYPGEDEFNVQRIFISDEEAADTATGPGPTVRFENMRVVGGNVRVLYPQETPVPARVVTVPVPAGAGDGLLRRITLQGVDAVIPRVVLASPRLDGQLVDVDSLSADRVEAYEDPFRLTHFAGRVTYLDGRVSIPTQEVVIEDSRARGDIWVEMPREGEPGGMRYGFDLTSDEVRLGDLRWVEPRLPEGTARGAFELAAGDDGMTWRFGDAVVQSEGSELELDGTLVLAEGREVRFEVLDLRASPVDLDRLDPWLERPLPLDGSLTGTATLSGPLSRLDAEGRVTLRQRGGATPTTADFDGILHLADGSVGFTGLRATLDPVDFGLVPQLSDLDFGGTGRVVLQATGSLGDAVRFSADVDHRVAGAPDSHVRARGSVRRSGDGYVIDVQSDASPLSFTALRRWYPDLPVTGEVSGSVRAVGPLGDLRLVTDLETEAGRLALDARLDATDPTAHYSAEGDVSAFRLSRLVPSLPDPTILTGRIDVEGRGTDPATATGRARLFLRPGSRVGGLTVDTAAIALRVAGGVLSVDTLNAVTGGVAVQGTGTLAMEPGGPEGSVTIAFQADSLGGLRPLLFGDSIIVQDELTPLEREMLLAQGVDADTLPTADQVNVGGSVSGEVTLTGSVRSFSAEGNAAFERVAYGAHEIQGATVEFSGSDLPSLDGRVQATVRADSLLLFGRSFAGADLEVDYARPRGTARVVLQRHEREDYRGRVAFELDSLGGAVDVEELALRFDSLVWQLEGPARVAWTGDGVRLDDVVLVRPGEDPLRIEAEGLLPTEGEADFHLAVDNLHLERLATLLQREDLGVEGHVDLDLTVRGTAGDPLITGTVAADSVAYRDFALTRVEADVDYSGRSLGLDLGAWSADLEVLTVVGTIPVDLALQEVEDRFPDRAMDLAVRADSLPAAFVLAPVRNVTEVEGTVSGRFTVTGTVESPEAEGTLALNAASFMVEDVGVTYRDVVGTLTLAEGRRVAVDATARAGGTARVTGTIGIEPLSDPSFDLDIVLNGFRAVDRPDVEGTVSGRLHLAENYRSPLVTGDLVVDQGTLFLEEVVRAATVVDLSDPRYLDLGTVVDTTIFSARPFLEGTRNPFMQNLRVSVDMEVRQDTWLRSEEINVEIAGELIVTYDRSNRDIVLVGDLQAVRGSYTILGRSFEVREGTVEFVGTTGINPNLAITAQTQVRQPGEPPIDVVASVTGTLENPQVDLSSDESALSDSDLVSYLIFGRPAYALTSGQRGVAEGASSSLRTGAGAITSVLSGTVANRLSSLLAQQWGFLDYFAITQVGDLGVSSGNVGNGLSVLAGTVVELGSYLENDLFFTLLLQPFSSGDQFAGARLEWQVDDYWTAEAFVEERFLRGQSLGFQDQLGFDPKKVFGLFVFWERGY